LGGFVELSGETWSNDELALHLRCTGERTGYLALYIPPGFRYEGMETDSEPVAVLMAVETRLLVISLRLINTALIIVNFTRVTSLPTAPRIQ
jgi:hypothetical protein